jgi:hypothetical protein
VPNALIVLVRLLVRQAALDFVVQASAADSQTQPKPNPANPQPEAVTDKRDDPRWQSSENFDRDGEVRPLRAVGRAGHK